MYNMCITLLLLGFTERKQDGHKYIMCQMCRTRRKREEKEKGKNEDAKTL